MKHRSIKDAELWGARVGSSTTAGPPFSSLSSSSPLLLSSRFVPALRFLWLPKSLACRMHIHLSTGLHGGWRLSGLREHEGSSQHCQVHAQVYDMSACMT